MTAPGAGCAESPALFVVVPNWNGRRLLGDEAFGATITSLLTQDQPCSVVVVDNGSDDDSVALLDERFPEVIVLRNEDNLGFAGGVNVGIRHALAADADGVALFNSDARAEPGWLAALWSAMAAAPDIGITTGKFLQDSEAGLIDSTGDLYSIWGLPYPRGRDEPDGGQYDDPADAEIFGASGGASLYRIAMLRDIGIFDEQFFAYYEDVDLSFRARLRGWRVHYTPQAVAHHGLSKTSAAMPGMVNYHCLKNATALYLKNMPTHLLAGTWWRFALVLALLYYESWNLGLHRLTLRAFAVTVSRLPGTWRDRRAIQSRALVDDAAIRRWLTTALPPHNAKFEHLIVACRLGEVFPGRPGTSG